LVEDIQWADEGSLAVLEELIRHLDQRAIWLIATGTGAEAGSPLLEAAADLGDTITVDRLSIEETENLAKSLVDLANAPALAEYLWHTGQGLPLAIAELVNLLWDERILIQLAPGRWALRADPGSIEPPEAIGDLIYRRYQKLPNSARRLIALAAVLGEQFDVEVLTRAADEHLGVVEIAVQLSLERWLIRQFPRSWSQGGPERDIVLWARGVRRGFFEFSHRAIRTSILECINPIRRRVMHAEVARALMERHREDLQSISEELAFHWLEAGEFTEALPWLECSADKAARAGAEAVEKLYRKSFEAARKQTSSGTEAGERIVPLRRKKPPKK